MLDVTALGELLIDFTATGAGEDGYPALTAHPGGAPANFLAALASLGAKTALLGKVGCDAFGDLLTETLRARGIETRGLVHTQDAFTTLAFVTLDAAGNRSFSFARKPGADTTLRFSELDLSLIDEAKVFHFGTLSLTDEPARAATVGAVEYAEIKGRLLSFDPNLRRMLWRSPEEAKAQMLWGLAHADVVKISDDEVDFLFGLPPAEGAAHILDAFGAKLVFVTCGAQGCVFRNAKAAGSCPVPAGFTAVDTTGAGDIFGGSALWKLLESEQAPEELTQSGLEAIARFACAAATLSTTRPGGISSVPSPDEIRAVLQRIPG